MKGHEQSHTAPNAAYGAEWITLRVGWRWQSLWHTLPRHPHMEVGLTQPEPPTGRDELTHTSWPRAQNRNDTHTKSRHELSMLHMPVAKESHEFRVSLGWRDGSAVKITGRSSRRPSSAYPSTGSSQPSMTPVPGFDSLFWSLWSGVNQVQTQCMHMYVGRTLMKQVDREKKKEWSWKPRDDLACNIGMSHMLLSVNDSI